MSMIANLSKALADQHVEIGQLLAEIERLRDDKAELLKKRNADEMQKMIDYWGHRAEKAEALVHEGLQLRERMPITWVERAEATLAGKEG